MRKIRLFLLLSVLFFACSEQQNTVTQSKNEYYLIEQFVDTVAIGKKGKHKVEIYRYAHNATNDYFTRIFFRNKIKNTSKMETFDGLNSSDFIFADYSMELAPEIIDFNNDGYYDLTYRSLDPARGGNDVRKLFMYDAPENEFIYIKNSEIFPNLQYNKELDCIISYIHTATQRQYFLKLNGEMLVPFAYIDTQMEFTANGEETYMYVYEIDKNNNEILIERKKADFEIIPYYSNYKPLTELKEK